MNRRDEDDRIARHDGAEAEELRQRLSAGDPEAIEIRLVQIISQRCGLEEQLQRLADELRQRLGAGDPEAVEIRLVQIISQRRDLEDQLQRLADTSERIGRFDLMNLVVSYTHGRLPP